MTDLPPVPAVASGRIACPRVCRIDFRERRIGNGEVLSITACGRLRLATAAPAAVPTRLACALATLLLGCLVRAVRWSGGGDVELLAACSRWSGPDALPSFLLRPRRQAARPGCSSR